MKNSENKKFEESWRGAFSDAEANPPDSVWTNIDLQLSRAESGDMKRRVVFYQRLAAASVVFAIALSGLGIWYSTANKAEQFTNAIQVEKGVKQDEHAGKENDGKDRNANTLANTTGSSGNHQPSSRADLGTRNHRAVLNKNKNEGNPGQESTFYPAVRDGHQDEQVTDQVKPDSIPAGILLAEEDHNESLKKNNEASLSEPVPAESKEKNSAAQEIQPNLILMEPVIAESETKKKTNSDENWWASLGGAAGSYNSNTITPMYSASLGAGAPGNSNSAGQNSRPGVGTSFSFGMNFGKKIAPRWMLMSGVNFLSQSNEYNSSVAMLNTNNSTAYAADFLSLSSATAPATSTTPYTINSVNEFVSIPFQTGYLFIDRKLGLQLNAGVATDFFVKSTLADQSGKLLRYTQGAGDNSPYRSVNWTGLVGTEFSYKVASHYRVSVVPGLRYSFNSVLKSTTVSTINPMVWDVGFRFRYMF